MSDEFISSKVQIIEPSNILVHNRQENYKSIDLPLLFSALYKKVWFVLFITVISTLLATGLTFFLKPQYKVTTFLTEPTANQYQDLFTNTNSSISQSELFNFFLKKLSNNQNFNSFVQQSNLIDKSFQNSSSSSAVTPKALFNKNSLKFKVIINQNKGLLRASINDNSTKITDDGFDAELTIFSSKIDSNAVLNKAYIEFTNQELLNEVAMKQNDIIKVKIKKLEQQINFQIETLKNQLSFVIARLESYIAIIKTKKDNVQFKNLLSQLQEKLYNKQYNMRVLTIENKSTDKILLETKFNLQQLKYLTFNVSGMLSYHMDVSSKVEKTNPNKKLIIILGIFFGFILATVVVLLQIGFKVSKELEI